MRVIPLNPLDIRCPTCGVRPGVMCERGSSGVLVDYHPSRKTAVTVEPEVLEVFGLGDEADKADAAIPPLLDVDKTVPPDPHIDGTVLLWNEHSGLTYVAIREAGGWWVTTKSGDNPLTWEKLRERHLNHATVVWTATGWDEV